MWGGKVRSSSSPSSFTFPLLVWVPDHSQALLACADSHGVEFVLRWSQKALFQPAGNESCSGGDDNVAYQHQLEQQPATGAISYTAWFVLGVALADSPSWFSSSSSSVATAAVNNAGRGGGCGGGVQEALLRRARAFASRNLRLRPAPPFHPAPATAVATEASRAATAAVLVAAAAAGLALYAGDAELLGAGVVAKYEAAAAAMSQWRSVGPAVWKCVVVGCCWWRWWWWCCVRLAGCCCVVVVVVGWFCVECWV